MDKKEIMFSGIQPSGELTIGNYLGAIKNWTKLQYEFESYYCIVDLHAITVRQEPKKLREQTLKLLSLYLASGIDGEKNTVFIQSHVPAHSEALWLLNNYTYVGELNRMTQYKEKSTKLENESIPVGLYDYPVLMSADILLYNTDYVPVGEDQRQHIELCRNIAERFNNIYSPTFKIPEPYINTTGKKIMDLQSPQKKMSKSSTNINGYILMSDEPDVIRKKISRAVTDNIGSINYSSDQPGIKNLIEIYAGFKDLSIEEVVKKFEKSNYGEFKEAVGEAIIEVIKPIQQKSKEFLSNKDEIEKIYKKGAERAIYESNKMLNKMKKKIGFILK